MTVDEIWMQEALKLAHQAAQLGEVPVGAIVVHQGKIIGQGYNTPITLHDPCAHAEIIAIRQAASTLHNYRLQECELYVTLEPCTMCAGAIAHARLKRLIYGATEPKTGAITSIMQFLDHSSSHRHTTVSSGILAEKCTQVLQDFFQHKRK